MKLIGHQFRLAFLCSSFTAVLHLFRPEWKDAQV
jgi:hypothetical protein